MRIIDAGDTRINSRNFAQIIRSIVVYAYLDTVEFFFRYLSPEARREIARIQQPRPVYHKRLGHLIGWKVDLNQPKLTKAVLLKLHPLVIKYRGTISRFDVALDMQADKPSELKELIITTAILLWSRGEMNDFWPQGRPGIDDPEG
jgi:hypothetical protein